MMTDDSLLVEGDLHDRLLLEITWGIFFVMIITVYLIDASCEW
jgi:hypothetical protein